MSRLTEKFKHDGFEYMATGLGSNNPYAIDKLGKLEDLLESYNVKDLEELDKLLEMATTYEELSKQLGCPLEIVFKALKNGIYTKEYEDDNKLELFKVRGIEKKGVSVISKISGYAECDFMCYYEDYKKTWWLKENREE